ncbi:hypothetical protein O3M35_011708 [Rhynocoris fuscipes]|uniref:Odorant receptor n=1 Tax=Rhynocoris fuscipes TaxID=488301 RepID=A0AAW1D1R8_9HEMI
MFISLLTIGLLLYTSAIAYGDVGIFAEAMHYVFLLIGCMSNALWYLYNKQCFDRVFRIVGSGFYYYGDTFDATTFNNEVDKQRYLGKAQKQRYTTAFLKLIAGIIFLNTIVRAIFEWLIGKYDNVEYKDGIIRVVPIPSWFFFDPESNLHLIGGVIFEYYTTVVAGFRMVCQEVPLISIAEELCSEFQILAKGVSLFDQRAIALYKILYGNNPGTNPMDKKKLEHCIKLCLRDSVRHHVMLRSVFYDLRRIYFLPLGVAMLVSTLLLCFSGILFTDKSVPITVKAAFLLILVVELAYTFIFCWYGQRIQEASCLINDSIYNGNWRHYSETIKSYILIIKPCSEKPLKLTAAGFIDIELSTFLDICKSAYSYFSLLQAFNE